MARGERNDLEFEPYPFPPKKGLLVILGLKPEATLEDYKKAWSEKMPDEHRSINSAARAAAANDPNPSFTFQDAVKRRMVDLNESYDTAFEAVSRTANGGALLDRAAELRRGV